MRTRPAAEGAVKAVLVHHQIPFPKTRQLSQLLTLPERHGVSVPARVRDAASLTQYAVESRDPGFGEQVTGDEYERALVLAETIVASVTGVLRP